MYIYRIQNREGKGCYSDKKTKKILKNHDKTRPLPEFDIGIERPREKGEVCGFLNFYQIYSWFSMKELKMLLDIGYCLKKVEVKKITAIGQKQVLAIQ
jgi:hypothetical protein